MLADNAWTLMHGWGAGGASWRGWNELDLGDDPAAFVRWADAYAIALGRGNAIDGAQLVDALVNYLPHMPAWHSLHIVLIGFGDLSPQQQRLLHGLVNVGATVSAHDALATTTGAVKRTYGSSKRDELTRAFAWACAKARADPIASIGIVIEDLATRRGEVRAIAEEILCPPLQWPGQEDTPRPYNISLGEPLAEVPLVDVALGLLSLIHGTLPVTAVATLVRSAFIDGATAAWTLRASVEKRWLEEGRREIGLSDVVHALGACDKTLADRWRSARDALPVATAASPREWVERWRSQLAAFGWPGDRALSSAEYQARGAWDKLLVEFASLGAIESRFSRGAALSALRAMAADTIFQAEASTARIQILGLLEAAGLPFDALWVAGLRADVWPRAPQPNPLLPLAWQRERNAPRATAAGELAFAGSLTDQFMRAAPDIVFSHAAWVDDHQRSPSALIAGLELVDTGEAPGSVAQAMFATRPERESVVDDSAPPVPPGTRLSGGASAIEKQSDCPFRAVAIHRLRAERWPEPLAGLTPIERGNLAHRTLGAFWNETRSRESLIALPPEALAVRIDAAAAAAMASNAISPARWRTLPPLVTAREARRLVTLLRHEIDEIERNRPPFEVRDVEVAMEVELAQMRFRLRADRVDSLEGGGLAVIDYKSGIVPTAAHWFDTRPQAPQLALYAMAIEGRDDSDSIRAMAYVQMKPGKFKPIGLAADATAWPGLPQPSALKLGLDDWGVAKRQWQISLRSLAEEIARGHAAVDPRNRKTTCPRCRLYAFCRIAEQDSDIAAVSASGEYDDDDE